MSIMRARRANEHGVLPSPAELMTSGASLGTTSAASIPHKAAVAAPYFVDDACAVEMHTATPLSPPLSTPLIPASSNWTRSELSEQPEALVRAS